MAQTGFTPISIYYSSTASAAPTAGNLVAGELAINTADGKLFYKDSSGVVQVIGTKGGVGSSTTTQVLYNSSGLVVGSANMTFNGTTFTLANDASISGFTVGYGAGGGFYQNAVFGVSALGASTTGAYNTAIGQSALRFNTTASNNTAVGYQAAYTNTTGSYFVAVGGGALYANTTGQGNAAFGQSALSANTTGSENTAIGSAYTTYAPLRDNTTGSQNIAVGSGALKSNTTASNNTAVGHQAGYNYNRTADSTGLCTFIGYQAGYNVSTAQTNVCIGSRTASSGAAVITGNGNTVVGDFAGNALQGAVANNTLIGQNAGNAITTGSKNTILGSYSGNAGGLDIRNASNYIVLSDGDGNPRGIFNGAEWLIQCTGIDVDRPNVAGGTLKQSNGNTKVRVTGDGTAAFQFYSPTGGTSTVGAISANAASTTYATTSDYRLKENIAPMTGALAKIALLKPVTYKWKSNGANGQGFIAHELQEVAPDCVTGEKDAVREDGVPIYQGIDTSFLVATLTAAIQELKAEVDSLKQQLGK